MVQVNRKILFTYHNFVAIIILFKSHAISLHLSKFWLSFSLQSADCARTSPICATDKGGAQ